MEGAIMKSVLFALLFGSLLGAVIIRPLAKGVGKVENATFVNSFIVCLISNSIYFLIWYIVGSEPVSSGLMTVFVLNLLFLSVPFIIVGKFVWKTEWIQSVKANSIWIVGYAIIMGFVMNKLT